MDHYIYKLNEMTILNIKSKNKKKWVVISLHNVTAIIVA